MISAAFLTVPLVIFCVFVAPIWLLLHYRSKRQIGKGLNQDDAERLNALVERTDILQKRVRVLERILDDEAPSWRDR